MVFHNLGLYSQHTQAIDAWHRVTVTDQVATIPPILAQPPLPLFFADGPMVDRQVFHHDSCPVLLPSAGSPVSLILFPPLWLFFFFFAPKNPWGPYCLDWKHSRGSCRASQILQIFVWPASFSDFQPFHWGLGTIVSLASNLYGSMVRNLVIYSTHACANAHAHWKCGFVYLSGNDLIFFDRK